MDKKFPTSRFGRLVQLAGLSMRSGAGMILKKTADTAAAEKAAEVLGNLRGIAAKVGQMASYVDGIVPEAQKDIYEATLKTLQTQASYSKPEQIRATIEGDLKTSMSDLFDKWDDEPMASASIGQVHRAVLHDGREVAVKVQHPNISEAVENDLTNIAMLEGMGSVLGAGRFDAKKFFDVVKRKFREELDYELEASRMEAFAKIHEGDPFIFIPKLIRSHCSKHVLCSELVRGFKMDEVLVQSEQERRAYAETLWKFVFKAILCGGMFNADPHPGNYIFLGEGKIAFLDFGCVQVAPQGYLESARKVHLAAASGDRILFRDEFIKLLGSKPGALEEAALDYCEKCLWPISRCEKGPYKITRAYAGSLAVDMKELGRVARKVKADEFFSFPADMIFMNRLQFGFYSVLARLDVEVDYRKVEQSFLS